MLRLTSNVTLRSILPVWVRLCCALALFTSSVLFLSAHTYASPVYKYQDENGRWHFTDKKPKAEHESVAFKAKASSPKPRLTRVAKTDVMVAENPWYAPVFFRVRDDDKVLLEVLVPAGTQQPLELDNKPLVWRSTLSYQYLLGDPSAKHDNQPLMPPIAPLGRYVISQGFNGKYSHTDPSNAYAVDIVMNVGSPIHAARGGVVVSVKDDYHMGGRDNFFADKANLIRVLHSDGSFGIYAHILLGSAKVALGQTVKAGDVLAQAGSSGYSTGPHLHFSVQVSDGSRLLSVPFTFMLQGHAVTPKARQWLSFQ